MDLKTANRLQQLRKENGYSQDALAEKLGLSRQAISKWERGESSPDTDNLIALAELYHMTLDQLLGGEPSLLTPPQPSPRQAAAVAQPAEQPKRKRSATPFTVNWARACLSSRSRQWWLLCMWLWG